MSTASLRDEVTDLLQRLIRVDTTNPPGNETAAAELLRDYLEANGLDCELIARVPERANLVARIPGGDGPSLLFLGHTDVVLADPAEWSVPPFAGELRDGHGLGTRSARHEEPGRCERGRHRVAGARGVPAERRPDLRGDRRRGGRRRLRPRVAVRGASRGRPLRLRDQRGRRRADRARRPPGSTRRRWRRRCPRRSGCWCWAARATPRCRGIADNALVKAAQLIERIAAFRPEPQLGPEVEALPLGRARRGSAGEGGGRAHARALARGRRCRRGAARADLLADHHLRVAKAERHPGACARSWWTAGSCQASIRSTSSR